MMASNKYDVFLSFRGEDTRDGFSSHLHASLKRRSLSVFIDYNLVRGDEISPSLLQAIEASKTSVVVLSKNYASSKWCLDELVKIMECRRLNGQVVIPVFYNVDPSHVRHQMGKYFDAFSEHESLLEGKMDRVQSWRAALKETANLAGWDSSVIRPESTLIEHIVEDIVKKLCKSPSSNNNGLVGIDLKVKQIEWLLKLDSADVRILGMWGMGGIGKTTLAQVIFDRTFNQFDACYFLENVREQLKRDPIFRLRNKLFSKLLEVENLGDDHLRSLGLDHIRDKISRKKVLIVLDDVDKSLQLQDLLVVQHHSFGPGSRIIITSRDRHVLRNASADAIIYEVKGLNKYDALELFSINAFKKRQPMSDFLGLSERVVGHSNGNPLALKVLGSALFDKRKEDWFSALKRFETFPHLDIYTMLKCSYDGLDDEEQNIFLDIAFFFKGQDVYHVSQVLHGYSSTYSSIKILVDKSLLSICKNNLEMHDVVQEMGWKIVHEECKEPGKRSRLRDPKDIHNILIKNKGTETVEGITLDISKTKELCLKPEVFARMDNLRILKFHASELEKEFGKVSLPQGLEFLSDQLRYLHWHGFPLKSLPRSFSAENLVELKLPHSNITELWGGVQVLVNLKIMDLQCSKFLTRIPDLSMAQNVVEINLNRCESLVELHSSVQHLMKLKFLFLFGCKNLQDLPSRIDSQYLEYLDLSKCSNAKICPEIQGSYLVLILQNSGVEQLPQSLCHVTGGYLDIRGCSRLKVITNLDLSRAAITELPSSIVQLCSLEKLYIRNYIHCKSLHSLPELRSSLVKLRADNCQSLTTFSSRRNRSDRAEDYSFWFTNCFELENEARKNIYSFARTTCSISREEVEVKHRDEAIIVVPGKEMPERISNKGVGSSICINIPKQMGSNEATTMIFCVIFLNRSSNWAGNYTFNFTNCFELDNEARKNIYSFARTTCSISRDQEDEFEDESEDVFGEEFEDEAMFVVPGKEMPEWISNKPVGSSICINIPKQMGSNEDTPLIFCVIFLNNSYISRCVCNVEVDGHTIHTMECFVSDGCIGDPSYHMLLWSPSRMDTEEMMTFLRWDDDKLDGFELSFRFHFTNHPFQETNNVERCGVCWTNRLNLL